MKVRTLRDLYPTKDIEVDGGLGPSTIDIAAEVSEYAETCVLID